MQTNLCLLKSHQSPSFVVQDWRGCKTATQTQVSYQSSTKKDGGPLKVRPCSENTDLELQRFLT